MSKLMIYQVLPRLWGDGRLSSFDEKSIDYLKRLGFDFIWFTGIPRHARGKSFVKGDPGSPYSISDWYEVNDYLADEGKTPIESFEELVSRVHGAGLKVMTDFIPNHVARDYKGGIVDYGWCDGDWTDTLKADWSDSRTQEEMLRVLLWWVGKGVDGFRCDMVELVPPDALKKLITGVRKVRSDVLFVAEVYDKANYRRYIRDVGFDLLYDKSGVYDIVRGVIDGARSVRELTWHWQFLSDLQDSMLNFLENHDEQRLSSPFFAGSPDKAWAALTFLMLFNRASFMLYFGQEVGEDAAEGDCGRTSIFNWCKPLHISHLQSLVKSGAGATAKERRCLARYRSLLSLATSPLCAEGEVWDLCYCNQTSPGFNPDRHFAFLRHLGSKTALVFCNFSHTETEVVVTIPPEVRSWTGVSQIKVCVAPSDAMVQIIRR